MIRRIYTILSAWAGDRTIGNITQAINSEDASRRVELTYIKNKTDITIRIVVGHTGTAADAVNALNHLFHD